MAYPRCDVCSYESSFNPVAASFLGPLSICICAACLRNDAQPLWLWHTTFDCIGGAEYLRDDLREGACSFHNGEYIYWDKILELYVPDLDMGPVNPDLDVEESMDNGNKRIDDGDN